MAGVTPGKGGQVVCGVPVFDSIEEAKENVDVNASIIFVPAPFAKDAAFESIDHLDLVIIITEHIPIHDTMEIMAYAKKLDGFIYISASHNPVGHNGIKFGTNNGGVLEAKENAQIYGF